MIMAHEQILLGQNCNADTYSANFLYSTALEPFHYDNNCQTASAKSLLWVCDYSLAKEALLSGEYRK
jgi:hypothetical protein